MTPLVIMCRSCTRFGVLFLVVASIAVLLYVQEMLA